jgi:hypothetical protein
MLDNNDIFFYKESITSQLSSMSRLILLKIDVEGHEMFVLNGSTSLLSLHKPHIILEFQPKLIRDKPNMKELITDIFVFLKDNIKYKLYYIMWEKIKYPTTDIYKNQDKLDSFDLDNYIDATAVTMKEIFRINHATNFILVPPESLLFNK